jgi:hypothetical protein
MNRLLQIIPAGALLMALFGCGKLLAPAPLSAAPSASTRTYLAVEQIVPSQTIKDYLSQKEGATAYGGKVFSAYQIIGVDQSGPVTRLYLWVFLQEFWVGQGFLHDGTASSLPVVLFIKKQAGRYQIFDFKDAGEGYQFLTVNFPPRIQALINLPPQAYNQRAADLSNETRSAAKAYFGIK